MMFQPTIFFAAILGLATAAPAPATASESTPELVSRAPASEFVSWSNGDCTGTGIRKSITDSGCYGLPGQSISILSLSPNCAVRTWQNDNCSGAWSQHVTLGACFDIGDKFGVSIVC
ncbi:Uu.00g123470.m01.CDS01 [Anthostomella pinea]|uniref:Uu.00g123470.m01.CDS01 n=1 Tax=Anthostomella pinea TaxID=933095 RepID=A0AAI8VHF2_9PEZI|nr:Uu.00g123470.m01.CDS01 [Anthostomella pinea]